MRSYVRPMVTGLCLMFGNAFVLRSNGIITRTLLKHKRQMEKRQENRIGFRSQKKTTKWIWWWKAKPGDKKAVMEMYFTNGINICYTHWGMLGVVNFCHCSKHCYISITVNHSWEDAPGYTRVYILMLGPRSLLCPHTTNLPEQPPIPLQVS